MSIAEPRPAPADDGERGNGDRRSGPAVSVADPHPAATSDGERGNGDRR